MPIEPVSIDASSDRMSPNMLPVTMTSNCFGLRTSCMAALSTYMWVELDVADTRRATSVTTSRQNCVVSSTLALSTEHSLRWRLRAASKPTAAMRRISLSRVAHGVEALALAAAR